MVALFKHSYLFMNRNMIIFFSIFMRTVKKLIETRFFARTKSFCFKWWEYLSLDFCGLLLSQYPRSVLVPIHLNISKWLRGNTVHFIDLALVHSSHFPISLFREKLFLPPTSNQSPSYRSFGCTLFEKLFGAPPTRNDLWVSNSTCFLLLLKHESTQLS